MSEHRSRPRSLRSLFARHRRWVSGGISAICISGVMLGMLASPSSADGDDAVVSTVISNDKVEVQSSKRLSQVTVVLCGGETIVADNWGANQTSGEITVNGIVQAVLIHSGNNTTSEAQALLALLAGDDAVNGSSTGEIAFYDPHACDEPGGDETPGGDDTPGGDETPGGDDTSTPDRCASSRGRPNTDDCDQDEGNPGSDDESSTPPPAAPVVDPQTTVAGGGEKAEPVQVLSGVAESPAPEAQPAPADTLPRTGTGIGGQVTLALVLLGAGQALIAATARRRPKGASAQG